MKNLMFLMTVLLSPSLFAQHTGTHDNQDYIVIVTDRVFEAGGFSKCFKQVFRIAERQGTGRCEGFPRLGTIAVNLTSLGADQVAKLSCVGSIEIDLENRL